MGTTAAKKDEKQAQEAPAAPRIKTSYIVLSQVESENGPTYNVLGTSEGLNDIDAIKVATAASELESGTFVAIPSRSFRVRKLQAQVRRSVSIT